MIERLQHMLAGNDARGLTDLRFALGLGIPPWLAVLLLALIAFVTVRFLWPRLAAAPKPQRIALVALRTSALVLILFLAMYPQFVGLRYDPSRNFLLMLFDDSRSMTIPDRDQEERGERVLQALEDNRANFENLLQQRYRLARYSFGPTVRRLRGLEGLTFNQDETDVSGAIEDALRDFQGINVSGVVLFSDGIDQPRENRAVMPVTNGVPVITVGTGGGNTWRDLEAREITTTRSAGDGRPVTVGLSFSAVGLSGRGVIAEILDRNRVIAKRNITLESDDEFHEVKLEFKPDREDWIEYSARVRLEDIFGGEPGDDPNDARENITRNNSLRFLVDNRPVSYNVLYFSGRPNWQNKFVQAALKQDEEIDLTSVLRISAAERKFVYRGKKASLVNPLFEGFYDDVEDQPRYDESVFLRFGGRAEDAGEGFPETAEDLYRYDLLVLGDIEAGFFSQGQLELVRDFIRKRGGTLLCLGGPNSFSEGRYGDTLIAGLLPVVLSKQRPGVEELQNLRQTFRAVPTVEGLLEGIWALDPNPTRNAELWDSLPELTGINNFPMLRPGAAALAQAEDQQGSLDGAPLFAMQRYGEGQSAVLATGSTWQWHMGTEKEDERHGLFWRRLSRALSKDVPEPVVLRHKKDVYVAGKRVDLDFLIRNGLFEEMPGLRVQLELTDPTGKKYTPGVEESLQETGAYRALFQPESEGTWRLRLTARDKDGNVVGRLEEALLVEEDRREFQAARYDAARLQDIAEATGGRFFELEELSQVPDRIPFVQHQDAETVSVPFWHWPGFYLAAILTMIADWYLRRKRGFA